VLLVADNQSSTYQINTILNVYKGGDYASVKGRGEYSVPNLDAVLFRRARHKENEHEDEFSERLTPRLTHYLPCSRGAVIKAASSE
jgi:hypothetical protein